jgi:hypothetical protein
LHPPCDQLPKPALATFHRRADVRQRRFGPVAFFVRYVAAVLLIAISSGCISLARIVAPTP